jgi:hypothetical protein
VGEKFPGPFSLHLCFLRETDFRMEEPAILPPPPSTPAPRTFKVGDLVQVFNGTAPNVRADRTLAYVGRIVGYNDGCGKWEVQFINFIKPSS